MNPYAGILFGYFTVPSFGCFGMEDGGFSIDIERDGVLTYKSYYFSKIEVTRTLYELCPETIEQIKTVISQAREQIRHLPNNICNGSCDGDMNCFIFNGKRVVDWNIRMHDIEKTGQICPEYLEEYSEVVRVENTIMELFEEIAAILSQNNVKLDLFDVQFGIPGEEVSFWHPYLKGEHIGHMGPTGGVIRKDEEHDNGRARIILEQYGKSPYSITYEIYNGLTHSVPVLDEEEANRKYEGIKKDLIAVIVEEGIPAWRYERLSEKWD